MSAKPPRQATDFLSALGEPKEEFPLGICIFCLEVGMESGALNERHQSGFALSARSMSQALADLPRPAWARMGGLPAIRLLLGVDDLLWRATRITRSGERVGRGQIPSLADSADPRDADQARWETRIWHPWADDGINAFKLSARFTDHLGPSPQEAEQATLAIQMLFEQRLGQVFGPSALARLDPLVARSLCNLNVIGEPHERLLRERLVSLDEALTLRQELPAGAPRRAGPNL